MKLFKKYGAFGALLFAVVAVVMLFIEPALTQTITLPIVGEVTAEGYTGFQALFGATGKVGDFSFATLKASTVGIIALVLLVAGALVPLLPMIPNKLRFLLGAALLLVAGVLFFIVPVTHGEGLKPAVSLILAGVFSLVAFLINGALASLKVK